MSLRKLISISILFEYEIREWFSPSKHSECNLTEAFWQDIPLKSVHMHDLKRTHTQTVSSGEWDPLNESQVTPSPASSWLISSAARWAVVRPGVWFRQRWTFCSI